MKNPLTILLFWSLLLFGSCSQSQSKKDGIFKTKSGKIFEVVETHPDGLSLSNIKVSLSGFEYGEDQELIEIDPINFVQLADLDNNGFEELYIITAAVGSGSYGNIYGFHSNGDKSVSAMYVKPISEKDIEKGSVFEGYMGHDKFIFSDKSIIRSFPIFLENDANSNASGGTRIITYQLIKGEASVILEIVSSELKK